MIRTTLGAKIRETRKLSLHEKKLHKKLREDKAFVWLWVNFKRQEILSSKLELKLSHSKID